MTAINSSLFEFIPMQMNVSTSIVRDALEPLELRNLVAKIIVLTVLPFLMITTFEALVINGTKILLNTVIVVVNGVHGYLFSNPAEMIDEEDLEGKKKSGDPSSSLLVTSALVVAPQARTAAAHHVVMPIPCQVDRLKVEDVVKKIAPGWVSAARHYFKLTSYREELKHLHPLQFLESIFGKASTVKKLMPTLMSNKGRVVDNFLGGLTGSIKNKEHKKMLKPYIPSFADRMGTTAEEVQSFLMPTENWQKNIEDPEPWQKLVEHLMEIHSTI